MGQSACLKRNKSSAEDVRMARSWEYKGILAGRVERRGSEGLQTHAPVGQSQGRVRAISSPETTATCPEGDPDQACFSDTGGASLTQFLIQP
jgi:hypothetical protein